MKNKSMLRVLALVVVLSMIFTTAVFATPGNKKMSRDEEGYKIAVESMIEKQIIRGYGHGDYGLEGNVKRGDVIVMIVRAFEVDISNADLVEDFADITEDEYFYKPVKAAKKLGIAKGDGKYFNPNKPVTVQEAIWLIERADAVVSGVNFDNNADLDGLKGLFEENEMGKFAKRKDIAFMLHYMMTGENDYEDDVEDDQIDDIKFEIDEDELLDFTSTDNNSEKSIENILKSFDSNIKYVKFDYPKNGTLYYEYVAKSTENELVSESKEYYLDVSDKDLLKEITFVPKKDFNGTVNISYYAYEDVDDYYSGKIVITVGDDEEELEDLALIKYPTNENTEKKFEDDLDSNMEEVKFVQPDEGEGTLYIDSNNDGEFKDSEKVGGDDSFEDSDFDQIVFVPAQDFSGVVDIKYTAKDSDDDSYSGIIRITVKEVQEIKTMDGDEVNEDKNLTIDFKTKLDDLTGKSKLFTQSVYNSIDYIIFESPSQGELMIDIIRGADGYENIDYDDGEYILNNISGLKYVPVEDADDEDELVTINFTAVDEDNDDKEYNGVIEITVVD
jgi:hypothetical protein